MEEQSETQNPATSVAPSTTASFSTRSPATAASFSTESPPTTESFSTESPPIAVTPASFSMDSPATAVAPPPSSSSIGTPETTTQTATVLDRAEKPPNPPPSSPSIVEKNQPQREDFDLNTSIIPLEITTVSPPVTRLSSITTSEKPMTMDEQVDTNLSRPRLLSVNPQYDRINRGTGYFRPNRAGPFLGHSDAGPSSRPHPSVLADPHRPHVFLSQNVQNPLSRAPNEYPEITNATPLRYRPPPPRPTTNIRNIQGTDTDLSSLPDLTPYQLQMLNELA